MDLFRDDPHYYPGVVVLCIVGRGGFAPRGERQLRHSHRLFALLFLLQWNLAMEPREAGA